MAAVRSLYGHPISGNRSLPRRVLIANGGLPPSSVAESADHPLLVSAFPDFGQRPPDRVVQRLVGEDVDEGLAPRHGRRQGIHLPQMDRGRAPVFLEVRGEEAERDCEPKEPPAFCLSDDLEFSARDLRPSEKEDPGDAAVAQAMDLLRMGQMAHRGMGLGPYSGSAFTAGGPRCSTFCPRDWPTCAESPPVPSLARATLTSASESDGGSLGGVNRKGDPARPTAKRRFG